MRLRKEGGIFSSYLKFGIPKIKSAWKIQRKTVYGKDFQRGVLTSPKMHLRLKQNSFVFN